MKIALGIILIVYILLVIYAIFTNQWIAILKSLIIFIASFLISIIFEKINERR